MNKEQNINAVTIDILENGYYREKKKKFIKMPFSVSEIEIERSCYIYKMIIYSNKNAYFVAYFNDIEKVQILPYENFKF